MNWKTFATHEQPFHFILYVLFHFYLNIPVLLFSPSMIEGKLI